MVLPLEFCNGALAKTRICAAEPEMAVGLRYAALSAWLRAEKYIRDASGWRKDVTDGNDNGTDGQTDGQTDRQSATQYAAPS